MLVTPYENMKSEKYNFLLQKYVQERLGSAVVSGANYIETAKSRCAEQSHFFSVVPPVFANRIKSFFLFLPCQFKTSKVVEYKTTVVKN